MCANKDFHIKTCSVGYVFILFLSATRLQQPRLQVGNLLIRHLVNQTTAAKNTENNISRCKIFCKAELVEYITSL